MCGPVGGWGTPRSWVGVSHSCYPFPQRPSQESSAPSLLLPGRERWAGPGHTGRCCSSTEEVSGGQQEGKPLSWNLFHRWSPAQPTFLGRGGQAGSSRISQLPWVGRCQAGGRPSVLPGQAAPRQLPRREAVLPSWEGHWGNGEDRNTLLSKCKTPPRGRRRLVSAAQFRQAHGLALGHGPGVDDPCDTSLHL